LWHFHVYMYYNLNWFIFFYFSSFYLSPLLWWFQRDLKFYIHSCIKNTSTIFTLLTSFFYVPPLICDILLARPVSHNIGEFVLGQYSTFERKHVSFGLLNLANFT
jgi:hypothetical protein